MVIKAVLRGKKGSILLFSLQIYLFFLGWFSLRVIYLMDYYESLAYLDTINFNLSMEKYALDYLAESLPNCPINTDYQGVLIEFLCNQNEIELIFHTSMPYSVFYDIIDGNIKAKG